MSVILGPKDALALRVLSVVVGLKVVKLGDEQNSLGLVLCWTCEQF